MGKVAALVLVFFLLSSQMDSVKPSAADCLDACSTACVQRDTRKMARCEGKCKIKCEPAFAAEVGHGF